MIKLEKFSVHGAPNEYMLFEGVLEQLESKLLERGIKRILIIHGKKSWEAAKPFWPEMKRIRNDEYTYSGECSINEIESLSTLVNNHSYDGLVGVGGGKVLDLTKSVGYNTNTPVILVPTLASNCSPWTPISVIYDEFGSYIRFDIHPNNSSLVLIEPRILIHAPLNMLVAGIGDTLAKWYEADVQMSLIDNKPVPLQISYYAAKQCKDLLLEHSIEAIEAVRKGKINDHFIKVVETIIVLGGMVGGFGDHYGRVAGAHAIHNGLTILEETHHALHGEKVAYGILVQLVLEDKWEEIHQLIPFYRELGLPTSLKELGVQHVTEEDIVKIAAKSTLPEESIHVMPIGPITKERVIAAVKEIEGGQSPIGLTR